MPPRRLITTSTLPPVVSAKLACISASPNIWVTANAPPAAVAPFSTERRRDREVAAAAVFWFLGALHGGPQIVMWSGLSSSA